MLKIGEKAPDFSLQNQYNATVRLYDLLKTSNVVIFFYPKDLTPGCTMQSCSFRDNYAQFKAFNTEVVGISADSLASHQQFSRSMNLKYNLLSDTDGSVRKSYKVARTFGILPGRTTYVIDKQGITRFALSSQFNINRHVEESLQFVKSMQLVH